MKKIVLLFLAGHMCWPAAFAQDELQLRVLDLRIGNPYVKENEFIGKEARREPLPVYGSVKSKLPVAIWPARPDVVACYNYAWRTAFSNLYLPAPQSGFVSPFIDAGFNKHIFMWDTGFMMMFGRYGAHAFDFQQSLDNFYSRQHKDGYICREIRREDGTDVFERYDISSTGPNILPWVEWEYFLNFNDLKRLRAAFSPLLAYYQWFSTYRSWPDGSYFSSGWGSGVDNQPRLPQGVNEIWGQGHMSWIDITSQQILAGRTLINMARRLGRENDVKDIEYEVASLTRYVNEKMWDDKQGFFVDRFRDGSLSATKSVVAYWALLARVADEERSRRFISHLADPSEFDRPVRIPALSADNTHYRPDGEYWNGGVWAPTTYMVLRGLTNYGYDSLAHEIALNNLQNVVKVYRETGTLWEHYAPETHKGMGVKNFVGWTGLVPITVLFEYVFGIRPVVPDNVLVWDVRLLDEHGVDNYPFGHDGVVKLHCSKRKYKTDRPKLTVESNKSFILKLLWDGGTEEILIKAGSKEKSR